MNRIKRPRQNNLLLVTLVMMSLQYIGFYYVSVSILPKIVLYIFYLNASIAFWLILRKSNTKLYEYTQVIFLLYILMFILSIVYQPDDWGSWISCFFIYLPIISGIYFRSFSIDFLSRVFKWTAICALCCLPYALTVQEIRLDIALDREYAWTESFFYASLFWAIIPATILSVLLRKDILLILGYWLGGLVLNLLFLKRFIIVDTLLLLLVIVIIGMTSRRTVIRLFQLFIAIFFLGVCAILIKGDFLLELMNATVFRIQDSSSDMGSFDRFVETEQYLGSASFFELLFGKGFSGIHFGLEEEANALHVGWSNFILKGGILFLVLILFPFIKLFFLARNIRKQNIVVQFSFWYLLVYSVRLTYVNMHNLSPEMLIFYYALYNIMAANSSTLLPKFRNYDTIYNSRSDPKSKV